MIILPTTYFGNIEYYSHVVSTEEAVIDIDEKYIRRTYRNRCRILGANGVMELVVPVHKTSGKSCEEVIIDNSKEWRHVHFRSIMSAYRNAPFYYDYIDLFKPILDKNHEFLSTLNIEIHKNIMKALNIENNVGISNSTIVLTDIDKDFRNTISIKNREYTHTQYFQVFSDRFPFTENLSVIDLVFNEGPLAIDYLRSHNK